MDPKKRSPQRAQKKAGQGKGKTGLKREGGNRKREWEWGNESAGRALRKMPVALEKWRVERVPYEACKKGLQTGYDSPRDAQGASTLAPCASREKSHHP